MKANLSVKQAAEIMGCDPVTIRNRIKGGARGVKLKAVFDGFQYRTCQEWIDEYLHAQSQEKHIQPVVLRDPHKIIAKLKEKWA